MATTDSSVLSIISAFTKSLDIFKDLREKRRKRKQRRKSPENSGDELRLSKSLRQGPVDVQREYERHYRSNGDRYAIGDCKWDPNLRDPIETDRENSNCPSLPRTNDSKAQHRPRQLHLLLPLLRPQGRRTRLQVPDIPFGYFKTRGIGHLESTLVPHVPICTLVEPPTCAAQHSLTTYKRTRKR